MNTNDFLWAIGERFKLYISIPLPNRSFDNVIATSLKKRVEYGFFDGMYSSEDALVRGDIPEESGVWLCEGIITGDEDEWFVDIESSVKVLDFDFKQEGD